MIGPENSCHSFNQSDAKLNPIMTWPPAFPTLSAVLMVANDDFFCYTSLHQFLISFSCSNKVLLALAPRLIFSIVA